MYDFGEIEKVPMSEIWRNEARDFTPWLADNIEALGNELGFELELVRREASVGDFSLDLLAKDLSNQTNVIIENQFDKTDHNHLGKLITYASGFNASAVIWVAESIREEHRQALDWLNQRTDTETQFFAVEVEVLKIDNSKPAFIFKPIVTPNEWQKSRKRTPSSGKGEEYRSYYQPLFDELREIHKFTNAKIAQPQSWYSFSSGMRGVYYSAVFGMGGIPKVGLYIDQGDRDANKALFDALKEREQAIHSSYGASFEWSGPDNKQSCTIHLKRNEKAVLSEMSKDEMKELRQWHIANLLKVKEVFGPLIEEILQEQDS